MLQFGFMSGCRITVVNAPHVRAFYHVLAYFDLGRAPLGHHNPGYTKAIDSHRRPATAESPARRFGRWHARYRASAGHAALPLLPVAFIKEERYQKVVQSLAGQKPPPPDVPPLVKRAIAPLADRGGARLVAATHDIIDAERRSFLDSVYRAQPAALDGVGNYLTERLPELCEVLFGAATQHVVVLPVEALATRSWALATAQGKHHIAVPAKLKDCFFHVLTALVRQRTSRMIRHYIPDVVRKDKAHPMNAQFRMDAALTTTYQLLLRKRPSDIEAFSDWALGQFRFTARRPQAAVEALKPMALLPEDAIPAVRALLGDELE